MNAQEQLEAQCYCHICGDIKTEPRNLDCNHSFCTLCLQDIPLQFANSKAYLQCPQCAHKTQAPNGVLSLPRTKFLDATIQRLKQNRPPIHQVEPTSPIYTDTYSNRPRTDFYSAYSIFLPESTAPTLSSTQPQPIPQTQANGNANSSKNIDQETLDELFDNNDAEDDWVELIESPKKYETGKTKSYFDQYFPHLSHVNEPTKEVALPVPHEEPKQEQAEPESPLVQTPQTSQNDIHTTSSSANTNTTSTSPPSGNTGFFSTMVRQISRGIEAVKRTVITEDDISSTATGRMQKELYYAPFRISQEAASKLVKDWIGGLWFAPSDLNEAYSAGRLVPLLIPFHYINAESFTHFQAQTEPNLAGVVKKVEGEHRKPYHEVLLCASSNIERTVNMAPFFSDFKPQLATGSVENLGVILESPKNWLTVWQGYVDKEVNPSEEKGCSKLAKQIGGTKNFSFNVAFSDIRVKTMYLPVFESFYMYQGKKYFIFVHGQSGQVIGSRPYGAGSIGRFVGSLFS